MMKSLTALPDTWRLYDLQVGAETAVGLAIIRVPLTVYPIFREVLGSEEGSEFESGGMSRVKSLTSSGKFKLVRERIGLQRPKPERHTK